MAKRPTRRTPNVRRSASTSRFSQFGHALQGIKQKSSKAFKRTSLVGRHHPFITFFVLLALLFLLIIGNNLLTPKPKEVVETPMAKEVSIYSIGKTPRMIVSAQVEKSGVIKIVALTPGVVSSIEVSEGQQVTKGTVLVSMATNYSGGNASSVQKQIAGASLRNIQDTYGTQKEIIKRQRELAEKNRDNNEELRKITESSLDDSRKLLDLNQDLVNSLKAQQANLESTNVGGANDAAILQTKGSIVQAQSGINQLKSQIKTTEYQTDSNNPPANINELSYEIAKRQLQVQERALQLSLETARLQYQLAQIMEATMFPAAPFDGVVERVYAKEGESVSPGNPLVLIHGEQSLKVVAKVPADIARQVSYVEPATVHIGDKKFNSLPSFISTEATDGNLYSVIFSLPPEFQNKLTNNEFIQAEIPVGFPSSLSAIPYIPIDIVFQTQDGAFVYVFKDGHVQSRNVTLGPVVGSYVTVQNGLKSGDQVILDRNVINGEKVKVKI